MSSKFYSEEELEQIAQTILGKLGLTDSGQLDVVELLRRLKHQGYIDDYVRVPDGSLPDAEAKYVAEERKIYIRASVFRAAEQDDPHSCFTVAHEASHAILNHQFERKRSLLGRAARELRVPAISRDESQADKLAATLLAPYFKANFSPSTTAAQIQQRFGLSAPMSEIRFEEMYRLYRQRNGISRKLPVGVIDFLTARRAEGAKITSLSTVDLVALNVPRPRYTGDVCPCCKGLKMIRIATHLLCDECGAITGDD